MNLLDSSLYSDLFWLFFSIATGLLMLWISITFRSQHSGASRALLVFAILDLPCSLFTSIYWNLWPMGTVLSSAQPFADPPGVLEMLDTVVSNLSTLLFIAWLVALLFVGFRFRQEQKRLSEMQTILEQKINE